MSRRLAFLIVAFSTLAMSTASAHKASDAYLSLRAAGADIHGRLDIALRDLDRDLDLDRDADDALSWREVRTRWADIAGLARREVLLSADGAPCRWDASPAPGAASAADPSTDTAPALTEHSDGRYAVLRGTWHCAAPVRQISIDYRLFAHTDPTHRGIVRLFQGMDDTAPVTAVLSPGGVHRFRVMPSQIPLAVSTAFAASAASSTGASSGPPSPASIATVANTDDADPGFASAFPGFVREGIHHILIGTDHILFLLSLLLPSVWLRQGEGRGVHARWTPAPAWRPALLNVLKVVTAFTVAHSITLALAVFNVVDPPSRWIESLIAASVVLAALNNVWPVVRDARWKLTFLFGLVHGFGFASALKDAGLARGALVAPLVGFNVGVELGQLGIVALFLPLAWTARGTRAYRLVFLGGSCVIAVVAGLWLVQRVFDLSLIAG